MPTEFRILGPVRALRAGRDVDVGPGQRRRILAALLATPGSVVGRHQLGELLWEPGTEPASAANVIQVHVSALRRALASDPDVRLVTVRSGYVLEVDPQHVDLHRFRALVAGAVDIEPEDPAEARRLLVRALELWPTEGDAAPAGSTTRARARATALAEERRAALARRIDLDVMTGHSAEALVDLVALIDRYPLAEHLHAARMRALAATGRVSEALAAYREIRERLVEEVGTDPGAELSELHQRLLLGQAPVAPRQARAAVPAQLPADLPDFVGRDRATTEAVALLDRAASAPATPVVAVIGGGGIGKTTFAVHVAHVLRRRFPDGQLFVDLRGQHDPVDVADVLAAFLRALGDDPAAVPADIAERAARYRSLLADRRVLVVLDDAADAATVRPLVPGGAGCAVLVTARSPLAGLSGVRRMPLEVLDTAESIRLLCEVVSDARTETEPDAVRGIILACGNLPLAVRIAASRLATRPRLRPSDLAIRLAAGAALDELHAGDLGVRASFAASYEHLDQSTARAFRVLAAPAVSGVDAVAAAATLGIARHDAESLIERLLDAYLVRRGADGRYGYHDLLRAYAHERVTPGECDAAVRGLFWHHLRTAVNAVRAMQPESTIVDVAMPEGVPAVEFTDTAGALAWLSTEHRDITSNALRLAEMPEPPVKAIAHLAALLANFTDHQGIWVGWRELAGRVLKLACDADDLWAEARARSCLVAVTMRNGDMVGCLDHMRRAARIQRELADPLAQAKALNSLVVQLTSCGEYDEAESVGREALALYKAAGHRRGCAIARVNLADLATKRGSPADAVGHLEYAWRIGDEIGDPTLGTYVRLNLGDARRALGQLAEAVELYTQALAAGREHSNRYLVGETLVGLARAQRGLGDIVAATEHYREAIRVREDAADYRDLATIRAELAELPEEGLKQGTA